MATLHAGARATAGRLSLRLGPLWSAAAVIAILTAGSKVLGLVKEIVVASYFGTSAAMDAFVLALAVPTFAINIAVGVLPMALTPAIVSARARDGEDGARRLAGTAFVQTYRVMAVLAVLIALVTIVMGGLTSSELPPTARALVPLFAVLLIPFTLLQGAAAAWSGVLAAHGTFAVSALATAALPLMTLVGSVLFGRTLGVASMVLGLVAGCVVQVIVLARALRRHGLVLHASGASLGAVNRQYLPAMGGAFLTGGCVLVDHVMASWLPTGAVSSIAYGSKFVGVGLGLAIVAIGTPLLPHVSALVEREDWHGLLRFQRRTALQLLTVAIPAALVLSQLSPAIVRTVYERGAFTAEDTARVGLVQAMYMLQLPGQFVAVLFARSIAAMRRNVLITGIAVVNLAVNVAANVVFMRTMGAAGIALSSALVQTVAAILLFVASDRLIRARLRATALMPSPSGT
jgi:putative peptidoglycan lipid II flippase